MLRAHIGSGADITIMYNREPDYDMNEQFDDLRLKLDEDGRVVDLALNPARPETELCSCDAFVMEKSLLEYLVEDAFAHARYDFMNDVLVPHVKDLNIRGWEFKGYVARLNSLNAFYRHNMALLDKAISRELFSHEHPIYTKIKDEFPARYVGEGSAVNSMIADGCIIEGRVENSILFRGVHVAPGAVVRNSIIMQASDIGEGSVLDHMILDKAVSVGARRTLSGHGSYPVILRKGSKV
jgi:glucose-1-phosphate adenylyltransferase